MGTESRQGCRYADLHVGMASRSPGRTSGRKALLVSKVPLTAVEASR